MNASHAFMQALTSEENTWKDYIRTVIVPNHVHDAINAALDAQFAIVPGAEPDREALYGELLAFYDEHGYVPDFSLEKKA